MCQNLNYLASMCFKQKRKLIVPHPNRNCETCIFNVSSQKYSICLWPEITSYDLSYTISISDGSRIRTIFYMLPKIYYPQGDQIISRLIHLNPIFLTATWITIKSWAFRDNALTVTSYLVHCIYLNQTEQKILQKYWA